MGFQSAVSIFLCGISALTVSAETSAHHDISEPKRLGIAIDALAFFHDNEYDSRWQKGYSLPGAWVRPTVQYNPNESIHLELGAHGLFFDGANRYPNYAYHDIGTWKGNQYQSGAHLLPWLRAEAKMDNVTIILGDIYGDTYHRIPTPLYNKEQVMSADPEMGAQILIDTRHSHTDIFLNWQSYQFELDTHQEAFTVGVSARRDITPRGNIEAIGTVIAQHRGGEQDITTMGVQTLCNASLGIDWHEESVGAVTSYGAQGNIIGHYQQAGELWPWDTGVAFHAEGHVTWHSHLTLTAGAMHAPRQFITLFGNPFFSTMSLRTDNTPSARNSFHASHEMFDGVTTGYATLDYHRKISEGYTFGAHLETFSVNTRGINEFNFNFGLYLRITPWFTL